MRLGFHLGPVSVSTSSRRKRKGETGAGPFVAGGLFIAFIGGLANSAGGTLGLVLMNTWFGFCGLVALVAIIGWLRS